MENNLDLQSRKRESLSPVGVILPAGGKGLRAGAAEPKQFLSLGARSGGFGKGARGGKPMLLYTIEAFHPLENVREIILVLPLERIAAYTKILSAYPKVKIVTGGDERYQSVRNGFKALDPNLNLILVHDVARPFVSDAVIGRCIQSASENECVIAAMPASDTVKEVSGPLISKTLDRRKLILVQTPQVFSRSMLKKIYDEPWVGDVPTDEAQMAERTGYPVKWVLGSEGNRKVTGAEDLIWAEWMASRIEAGEYPTDTE